VLGFARFPSSLLPSCLVYLSLDATLVFPATGVAVLEDDQIFLHHQERYLEEAGGRS